MMAYQAGGIGAERAGDAKLESVARVHRADLEEKLGDLKGAASDYESAIALDARVGDPRAEAVDWFNYGRFLGRRNSQKELAYACLLHAENLLAAGDDSALATIRRARAEVRKNLDSFLSRAASLP